MTSENPVNRPSGRGKPGGGRRARSRSGLGHQEIFERLRREILSGKFGEEAGLPSETALARRFGVSRPTMSRVMLDMKREGLIVTRRGAPAMLTRFAHNATGDLGIVVPGVCYAEIFPPIVGELKRLAEQGGWRVLAEPIRSDRPTVRMREARRIAYRFAKERVAGVVFQPMEFVADCTTASRDVLKHFDALGIPVLLLDYDIVPPPDRSKYDLVGVDNVSAGLAVGRHLVRTGARNVCFLQRPGAAPTVADRLRGVACAMLEANLPWSFRSHVLRCEPDDRRAVARFVAARKPDAIVSGNDAAAARLKATLDALGRADGIRLAGFDDVAVAARLGLTTCRLPLGDLALVAFQTLVQRIRSPHLPPLAVRLAAPLVVRSPA